MIPLLLSFALFVRLLEPLQSLDGPWRHTEIRGVEEGYLEGRANACWRIWIERREYQFVERNGRVNGIHVRSLVSEPLGMASAAPTCRFAGNVSSAFNYHTRTWEVAGRELRPQQWDLQGMRGGSIGPLTLLADDFSTIVELDGEDLLERSGDESTVRYKRPASHPDARATLEHEITRLRSGECESVHSQLMWPRLSPAMVEEACHLLRMTEAITGRLRSLRVTTMEHFDQMPNPFPGNYLSQMERVGVFFSYELTMERQTLFESAIVWKERDEWRLAFVWH